MSLTVERVPAPTVKLCIFTNRNRNPSNTESSPIWHGGNFISLHPSPNSDPVRHIHRSTQPHLQKTACSGVLLTMEVGIRKRAWQRA